MKSRKNKLDFEAIVIGVSAGGKDALEAFFSSLPGNFPLPLIVIQHRLVTADNYLIELLNERCNLTVKEMDEKESVKPGIIYIAPPAYHLLIEDDKTFSFSYDQPVCYARPSVDVLFESASDVYGPNLIGIVLTGANHDGSAGLKKIKERGGLTIVQNPETAEYDSMPKAAIAVTEIDHILPLDQIGPFLVKLVCSKEQIQNKHLSNR